MAGLGLLAALPAQARHQIQWNSQFREVRVASKLKVAECGPFRGRPLSRQVLLDRRKYLPDCPQFQTVGETHTVNLQGLIVFYVVTAKREVMPGEYKIDPTAGAATRVDLTTKMY